MSAEQTLALDEQSHPNTAQGTVAVELAPIDSSKRIDVMDILRGFALIGIILMNIEWFNRSIIDLGRFDFSLNGVDWSAGWFIRLLVEGKFYKIFSLLFGMGFAIMLLRAVEVGRPFGAWFSRRMIYLFLFGMAHMIFLWGGDILHDYAAGGLLLLGWVVVVKKPWFKGRLNRFDNPRSFLRFGLFILALPLVIGSFAGIFFGNTRTQDVMLTDYDQRLAVVAKADLIKQDPQLLESVVAKVKAAREDEDKPEVDEDAMSPEALIEYKAEQRAFNINRREQRRLDEKQAFTQPSYWQATVYRAKESIDAVKETPFFAVMMSFPLFLIGYWFVASGVMREPRKHLGLFKAMAWIGIGPGLLMSIVGMLIMTHPVTKNAIEIRAASNVLFMFAQFFVCAGYVGLLVLAGLTERGQRWMAWLAPMGRMALTNYITHSIILSMIFYGYAGGMFGEISRGFQVLMVVVIIVSQAFICRWWLNHYQFGPLEWLWRSLSYNKIQPMRVEKKSQSLPIKPAATS